MQRIEKPRLSIRSAFLAVPTSSCRKATGPPIAYACNSLFTNGNHWNRARRVAAMQALPCDGQRAHLEGDKLRHRFYAPRPSTKLVLHRSLHLMMSRATGTSPTCR